VCKVNQINADPKNPVEGPSNSAPRSSLGVSWMQNPLGQNPVGAAAVLSRIATMWAAAAMLMTAPGIRAEEIPPLPQGHTVKMVEGWTIQVDDRLLNTAADVGRISLDLLRSRLADVKLAVPGDKLIQLQKVTIWLDLTHGKLRAAQYHPSAGWLKANGYSEQLARAVHIPDAAEFNSRGHQRVQPWSVMHELAHAYHDQVLDFEQAEIKAAWEAVRTSGRFEEVLHINGHTTRHYALTNQKEFFAEMSESFLGTNDFYPFNRAELKRDFPEIHSLLHSVWEGMPEKR